MSYSERTNSRVRLEQLHAEAARGRIVHRVQRQRLTEWLRKMADAIDRE